MIPPRISRLKEEIDILNVTAPYDVLGAGTIVSTFCSSVRAAVEPLGGTVSELTQQKQAYIQAYNIWIRYRHGVTPFQQIKWGSKRLIMTGPPEEIERRRWLLIHAEERTTRTL